MRAIERWRRLPTDSLPALAVDRGVGFLDISGNIDSRATGVNKA